VEMIFSKVFFYGGHKWDHFIFLLLLALAGSVLWLLGGLQRNGFGVLLVFHVSAINLFFVASTI